MSALRPPHPYPEHCQTAQGSPPSECLICNVKIKTEDWSITHGACRQLFCVPCLLTWSCHSTGPASCPMCRGPLGSLVNDAPMKTFIVNSLDELRNEVGDQIFLSTALADHRLARPVTWDEIDTDNTNDNFAINFNQLENLRNVLLHADETGQELTMPYDMGGFLSAIGWFDVTAAIQGYDYAIDLALDNDWVNNQLRARSKAVACEQAHRYLFQLSRAGVRNFEAWKFPEYDTHTIFYTPIFPCLRVLDNIDRLRGIVASRRAYAEFNQTGSWLDPIYTTDQLLSTFKLDPADSRSACHLEMLPQRFDLEGYAVFQTDDMDDDALYAVPRARFPCPDLPLREPESYFIGENGPEKLHSRDIDWSQIPAGMVELWVDLFRPEADSP